jgi:hypothetical protein|tara:strand:- start:450 stop:815 length:366 start_codon:yes stop_codon:yes gene_type:complete
MEDKSVNILSLFASSSTLICCALPAMFVALGAGASFAALVTNFPFLIVLSQYKTSITIFAFTMIIIAGYANYKTYHMPCPADPELGRACLQTRKRSRVLYYFSTLVFVVATSFTYIVPAYL